MNNPSKSTCSLCLALESKFMLHQAFERSRVTYESLLPFIMGCHYNGPLQEYSASIAKSLVFQQCCRINRVQELVI